MRWTMSLFMFALLVCFGCSRSSPTFQSKSGNMAKDRVAGERGAEMRNDAPPQDPVAFHAAAQADPKGGNPPQQKAKAEQQRKIRYTADLRLVVEDFSKAMTDLEKAIDEAKGRLATSELNSASSSVRTGTWRVRVPVENLAGFRDAVRKIGEVELDKLDSEDLTDRYYDLEAHIKNRNAERDALRDLLKEVGKKEIKYYLEIKRELDIVSDDINRKEGQLRLWANLTDLTTCTVYLREKQKFGVQTKVEDKEIPTFGKRAGTTWTDSWENFLGFCQGLILFVIALIPWLPLVAVFVGVIWLAVRRIGRAWNRPIMVTPVEDTPKSA